MRETGERSVASYVSAIFSGLMVVVMFVLIPLVVVLFVLVPFASAFLLGLLGWWLKGQLGVYVGLIIAGIITGVFSVFWGKGKSRRGVPIIFSHWLLGFFGVGLLLSFIAYPGSNEVLLSKMLVTYYMSYFLSYLSWRGLVNKSV